MVLDGRPFTYYRHEYLKEPYQDEHPFIVEKKAAQMGLTSKAILKVAYAARFMNLRGIIYFFPSKTDVTEFSKGRVSPLIEDNPDTLGSWIRDTDAANIKRIHNTFLYLRGMRSRVGLKSVPADMEVFDELDEAPQNNVTMAMQRMAHSESKHVLMLSNPTLPDYGISLQFKTTDQRYWLLKCTKCNDYTNMVETFPDCIVWHKDKYVRLCQHCRDNVLNPAFGEWVAKHPTVIDRRGYQYSQLFSQFVTPTEVMHQFLSTENVSDFWNLVIGVDYIEAENRLTIEEIEALAGDVPNAYSDKGPCSLGVDQGKVLNVVVGKKHPTKAGQIVHLGEYKDWEDVERIIRVFNVSRGVIDALPETREARKIAEKFNKDTGPRIFLCYYQDHQKGAYAWNERDYTVTVNRTESLDASHQELKRAEIILPAKCDLNRTFAEHCHNIGKKLEEDEKTKEKWYDYVPLGSGVDHFRHAFNYEAMARKTMPQWLFPEAQ